ncbi:hypothetical protein OIU79_012032 [Salix purpurea]|uniref:Uncharacterized protein n=1 Tax=Salix purpurea TaxID=77065 RepID=A0A9Q0Q260_SALPP|nr:hypothetical protein OIU79_012032 [Salix purpurea]
MLVEVDAAAGGWEQVRKKHRSNRHSSKKLLGAAADASAGLVLLAEKSKSVANLSGLNSELDVGLAAGIAVVPPPSAAVQPRLSTSPSASFGLHV